MIYLYTEIIQSRGDNMFINTLNDYSIFNSLSILTKMEIKDITNLILEDTDKHFIDTIYDKLDIDEVLIHHISRRINGSNFESTYNLHDLLVTDNKFSNFLKRYGFSFKKTSNGISMIKDENTVPLESDKIEHWALARIRNRLIEDSCINGYAIAELSSKNSYMRSLNNCPEFIRDLSDFFDEMEMAEKYKKISSLYIISYKLPINQCLWCNARHKTVDFKEYLLEVIWNYLKSGEVPEKWIRTYDDATISAENIFHIQKKV